MEELVNQLMAQGAHRSLESAVEFYQDKLTLNIARDVLQRRFPGVSIDLPTTQVILGRAERARTIGEILQTGGSYNLEMFPVNTSIPQNFQYATVVQLPKSLTSQQLVDVPYTIDSDIELTPGEIQERALNAVLSPEFTRDCVPGALGADEIARDIRFKQAMHDLGEPVGFASVLIMSAYRRS